jgi:tryptophan-rich sensory protein
MIIKLKPLLVSLLITLSTGAVAGLISAGSNDIYTELERPALAPPSVVFPIVWTILYLLMGVSLYMIYTSYSPGKDKALKVFGVQLLLNFIWPLVFFNMRQFSIAFIILILLWLAVAYMIYLFYQIKHVAAYLQIPYFSG